MVGYAITPTLNSDRPSKCEVSFGNTPRHRDNQLISSTFAGLGLVFTRSSKCPLSRSGSLTGGNGVDPNLQASGSFIGKFE